MRQFAIVTLLLVAACSKSEEAADRSRETSFDLTTADNVASDAPSAIAARGGPGIDVTAAPGVAFNYRYAFRLPAGNIDKVQEQHAQACEKLGIARCRITGMRYTLDRRNQVEAALAFKLDPALARAFGREGIAAIQRAEGMLVDAEITGTDAGAEIDRIDTTRSALTDDRARVERELTRPGLAAAARTELLRQRGALDEQVRAASAAKTEQQASLARTPVSFSYESGQAIRGFDPRSPFADAADTAIASTQWTLAFVLGAIALLGPPALLLALLFLLWRWLSPRLPRRPNKDGLAD